jgi:hypothetical protein
VIDRGEPHGLAYGERAAAAVDHALARIAAGDLSTLEPLMDFFAERRAAIAAELGEKGDFGLRRTADNRDYVTGSVPVLLPDGRSVEIYSGGWGANDVHQVANALVHADGLYRRALDPGLSLESTLQTLGQLHWLMINVQPYVRGTPAITDMIVRSVLIRRGIEAGAWKTGPQLAALETGDPGSFGERYADLFARPPAFS